MRPPVPIALAVLACLVAPAIASGAPRAPGDPLGTLYEVTLSAERSIGWRIPRHKTFEDCHRREFVEGSGEERWALRTREDQRVRVLVTGGHVTWVYPFEIGGPLAYGVNLGGLRKRSGRIETTSTGGTCGTRSEPPPGPPETDCGTRLPSAVASFHIRDGRLGWIESPDRDASDVPGFERCPLFAPAGVAPAEWTDVTARMPASRLNGRRRTVTVKAHRAFKERTVPIDRGGELTTRASVRWKVVFRRVGRRG